ncbi:MAG: aspartate aminotransferase family protein [Planctomycetota bacterium]|nr:aspartate aminotransferase family protein [Planctomycetota bacterium]MDA1248423.1 aspartate aminotransferase family protein [Planctomycetota bacterium]
MEAAATRSSQETIAQFDKYVIPNYGRYPISLVRGEGSYVWDAEGNRYLDLFPGWGCNILGHCPAPVVEAVQKQVANLVHIPNSWYIEAQGDFAEAICTRSFGKAFFCNSGAEANEGALKLARLHGMKENRYRVITFERGFHGRTLATTAATAQPKYHEGLGPLVAGFDYAPYGDLAAVEELVGDETAAIMIEPVQGEGGVQIPPDGYLEGLRRIADDNGCLLIFDEVQTCMGRTGSWFGYQQFNVKPDVLTMAKGIAAGVACGAVITTNELAPDLRPGMHASTFGGNPIAMAAGCATVKMIEDEGLLDNVADMSARLRSHFEELKSELSIIEEIRTCGMMIGVELSIPSTPAVGKCMQKGVLINATQGTVIRLLPALNVTADQVDEGCAVIAEVIREMAADAGD